MLMDGLFFFFNGLGLIGSTLQKPFLDHSHRRNRKNEASFLLMIRIRGVQWVEYSCARYSARPCTPFVSTCGRPLLSSHLLHTRSVCCIISLYKVKISRPLPIYTVSVYMVSDGFILSMLNLFIIYLSLSALCSAFKSLNS